MIFVKMTMKCLFIFCFLHARTQAQVNPLSVPYLSAAQYSPQVADAFTSAFNPATLQSIKGFEAGMHSENRFLSAGLSMLTVCASMNSNNNGISLLFQYFGDAYYNQQQIGINYGKSFGNISLGAIFSYRLLKVAGSSPEPVIGAGISSVWKVSEKVYAGFRLIYPQIFPANKNMQSHPASVYAMGLGFQTSDKVYIGLESEKEEKKPPQIIMLLRYQFDDEFFIRMCWQTASSQPFFSGGLKWKSIKLEAGCSYHLVLGPSPTIMIAYQKK